MRRGQQVRITANRGPVTNKIGYVDDIIKKAGRTEYGIRLEHPYSETLIYCKIWEISRTTY